MIDEVLRLKVIYVPPKLDDKVGRLASQLKMSRSDVFEELLMLGMMIADIVPTGK